ncbi:hypothetical protein A2382_01735 [Candidatus Woesebacteria bacterium RIFOXYB1_FULL_38_16]|uniref:Zinc-ribbon domain-containing protein n=1 Tax=Candidatus Woesebacteria bacterium RIFOXYB1_FULL_38_16 TaxID=1802538 RepID=A0A1F8CUY9_9BACT|nr:MAG: hypothetical protein A2191_03310 [Candidatus Woesebacteria bacterium RIFOXYA1_FULL_38_9]OGM80144.1 MAG: hypothetical protein A2382_01735 [Candidatus Woesebacteria bacterium RIFOXYB1_FULL_38_16]
MNICTNCRYVNDANAKFCNQCGHALNYDPDKIVFNVFVCWIHQKDGPYGVIYMSDLGSESEALGRAQLYVNKHTKVFVGGYHQRDSGLDQVLVQSWKQISHDDIGSDQGQKQIQLTTLE